MCDCISYNMPKPYQKTPSVILKVPEWASRGDNGETICVDPCVSHVVQALWAERIWTLGSCCGHNGEFDRNVIVNSEDRSKAEAVVARLQDTAVVGAWELVWSSSHKGEA